MNLNAIYIHTHTDKALEDKNLEQIVEVEFGDLIDYRERQDIQTLYKKMFSI